MSWVETLESQRVTIDAEGIRTGIRVYRVWGYARAAILGDPSSIQNEAGNGLPNIDSVWEEMTLRKYSVVPVGSIYDVTGEYSNAPDPLGHLDPNFVSWSNSFATKDIPLPYAKRSRSRLYIPNPSAPLEPVELVVDGWNFYQSPIITKVERFVCRANFSNPSEVTGIRAAIREQTGKLHKIAGLWSIFEGADFTEQGPGVAGTRRFEVQYSWSSESGCRQMAERFIFGPPDPDPWFPWQQQEWPAGTGSLWIRPPFHTVIPLPGSMTDPDIVPRFKVFLPHDDSQPLGWQTLPGVREPP